MGGVEKNGNVESIFYLAVKIIFTMKMGFTGLYRCTGSHIHMINLVNLRSLELL